MTPGMQVQKQAGKFIFARETKDRNRDSDVAETMETNFHLRYLHLR